MKREILCFDNRPHFRAVSSVVGDKENDGPLSEYFDMYFTDTKIGQLTWEKAETELVRHAIEILFKKSNLRSGDIDIIFSGDLINQCTVSTFGILEQGIPTLGLYGACSTFAEGLLLASSVVNAGYAKRAACVTSSHFCTAERQFRFPIEYGSQKTPTSQSTVTGSGAAIIEAGDVIDEISKVYINNAMIGIPKEMGITDANNMGAAMAPAAADTIIRYFRETNTSAKDYDLVITGDLGYEGHDILKKLLCDSGIYAGENFTDCGIMIYDTKKQDMHAGGSGCGCSATVMSGYFIKQLSQRVLKNILFIGTGALLSPLSVMQGLPIPGIAHLVNIRVD
ncbi:MAG: stage V sporulation protein AD [Ruminococcaceae bacterium]|nr:stage V sporulation protein AD [Oscillospiraceae bacterium]